MSTGIATCNPLLFANCNTTQPLPSLKETGSHSSKEEFEILLERLDPKKKKETLDKIASLENKDAVIAQIVQLATTRNYKAFESIFLNAQFEYYALAAVQEKKLSPMQLGSLTFVHAGLTQGVSIDDIEVVPLFAGGAPSTQAWNQINDTLKSKMWAGMAPAMDAQELAQFFEIMRTLPPSEQFFVIIPDKRQLTGLISNLSRAVNENVLFNVFCSLQINGKNMRMIPSYGMAKALLDATGTDGFSFKFVLGASLAEHLRLSILKNNAREMCIHCKETSPTPGEGDGFPAPDIDFIWHEIYHGYVCRHIPLKHRQFYSELAAEFNPDKFSSQPEKCAANYLYEILVDLDIESYRPDSNKRPIDPQQASMKAIRHLLDVLLPAKVLRFPPQEAFTPEENNQLTSDLSKLTEKARGLFAIWKLYKQDYKNFDEITEMYSRLAPEMQQRFGRDFIALKDDISRKSSPTITDEELAKLQPHELKDVLALSRINPFALMGLVGKGISFTKIWGLEPKVRELIVLHYTDVLNLLESGAPFPSLSQLEPKLLEFIFKDSNSFSFTQLLKKGIEFQKAVKFLTNYLNLNTQESYPFFVLANLFSNEDIDSLSKLESKSLQLMIDNCFDLRSLIESGTLAKKVFAFTHLQLESIFTYISEHHFDATTYRRVDVKDMVQMDSALQRMLM